MNVLTDILRPFWHARVNGEQMKNLFPQLWRGSMDKEDGKYLVLHHR